MSFSSQPRAFQPRSPNAAACGKRKAKAIPPHRELISELAYKNPMK